MPTKIRLQRYGKKAFAYFHIVVADGRAPRDGKFIEKIGTYNPNTNPATIDIDQEKAFEWIKTGAEPTDTCRAILSYKGILYRHHLYRGVQKGALTQEQADAKFAKWLDEKSSKVEGKKTRLADSAATESKTRFVAEQKAKEARAAKIAAKNAPPAPEPEPESKPEQNAEAEAPAENVEKTENPENNG
ncbi:MAG TPA: 30S ribosomal protein S16 [Bacteroidia bacterium]|nr:30S ribosomal protein S16 [Bacteroidia bacterium]